MASTSSINGIGSGLDVNGIVDQLMSIERQGQTRVVKQRDSVQARLDALGSIRSQLSGLNTAAAAVDQATKWNAFTTSSSDSDTVTAAAKSTATTGSLTFTVDQLASAAALRSSNTIASTNTVVTSGNLLIAKGGYALGFSTFAGDESLPTGNHDIRVIQASAGAAKTAGSALNNSTVITTGVNDTITAEVDGAAQTFTIAAGTYNRAQLATAVASASGGVLTATVTPTTNKLVLRTTHEGSAASLMVTGGTALSDLGLTTDASASTGIDGIAKVDETTTTLTSITTGSTVSLTADTGTISATLAGGLRVGYVKAKNVSTGTGSLSAVVNAINQANVGVSAAAVQVGTGAYRLQITATSAGSANRLNLDASAFSAIGGVTEVSSGSNAKITIGSGDGAYSIESASNDVVGVLPGVTLTVKKLSTDPVTVTIARDAVGIADKIQTLTNAANTAINELKKQSAYDPTTKSGGPLAGNSLVRSILSSITQAVTGSVSGSTLGSSGIAGMSTSRDGKVQFDRTKFLTAYNDDPDAVADLFVRRGSATSADVSFKNAAPRAQSGTYAVNITTAPVTAAVTGNAVGAGTITSAETIDIKVGATTATYAAAAGETLTDIVSGLNTALGASGLTVSASVSGNRITLTAANPGTTGTFSVRSNAAGGTQTGLAIATNVWEEHAGVNVAGTIDGRTSTGSGNVLTVANTDAKIPGMAVAVTATSTGSLGTLTYAPGIAARLSLAVASATDLASGSITTAEKGNQTNILRLNRDLAAWDRRLGDRQIRLRLQYASLDTTLGQLRNQSSWISSQLSSLGR
ncbi:MAG: flagellar filament capping protein FliD [Acidimicrobiia bacterium]